MGQRVSNVKNVMRALKVKFLDQGRLKIRSEGGEKVNRPLAGVKESFQKKKD